MTLLSKLALSVTSDLTKTAGLAEARVPLAKIYQAVLNNGTGVGNADLVYHAQRTLAASATEDLDLAGILTDPLGATLIFAKVKGLIAFAAAANTNNVVVGAAAVNPWVGLLNATGTVTLRPGALWCAFAGQADGTGYAVTGGTGDLLKVANGGAGTSVTYDIIVVGTSV